MLGDKLSIPFLVIDRPNLLIPAAQINKQKQVGIMTHACTSANFRKQIKDLDLIKICDSGVFLKSSNQQDLSYEELFARYEEMNSDYGIIFDVLGDAIATIKSATEAISIYSTKRRSFKLIGVAQGQTVEEYVQCTARLIELGYQHIAIGGMLRKHEDSARYVKVKNDDFLIKVLEAVREVWQGWLFCLGCYHPSRVEIFEKYGIFGSDSKRWAFQCDRGLKTEDRHKQLINNFLQRNLSAGKNSREIQDGKLLGDKCSFKQRVTVERCDLKWAQELVTERHYLHRPIHPRSLPFAYSISLDGLIIGTIIMATIHYTKKKGLFGYDGLPTKWQVLQLARLWIDPKYQGRQSNGHANNIASCAIAKMLKRVNRDWLEHHPPVDPNQPYKIKLILSYADTGVGHEGTIYKAANFERFDETTNNRSRHGTYKGNNEPKILYVYRLNRKLSKQKLLGDKLSIPCEIREPHKEPVEATIIRDRGSEFDVMVTSDQVIRVAKLYVYPKLPAEKKCRTTPDLSPSKKSRREKGKGSGTVHYREVKRGAKTYKQAWRGDNVVCMTYKKRD